MDNLRTAVFWEAVYRALGMIRSALRKYRQNERNNDTKDFIETVELATEAVASGIHKAFLVKQK